LTPSR